MDEQSMGPRHKQLKGLNETEHQKVMLALNNITQKAFEFWRELRNSKTSTHDDQKLDELYTRIEQQLQLFQIETQRMTADDGHIFFKLQYEFVAYYTDPYACVTETIKKGLSRFCLYYLLMERVYMQDISDYSYRSLTYDMLNFTAGFMKQNIPYVQKISEHLNYIEVLYDDIQEVQDVLTGLFDNYLYYDINYMPQCYEMEENPYQKVKISQIQLIRLNKYQLTILNITPELPPITQQQIDNKHNENANKQIKEIPLSKLENTMIQLINKKKDCINVISTYQIIKNLQMNSSDISNTDKATISQAHKQMLQWQTELQTNDHEEISNNIIFYPKYKYKIKVIPQHSEQLIDRFSIYVTYQSNKQLIQTILSKQQHSQHGKKNDLSYLNTSITKHEQVHSTTTSYISYQKKIFGRPMSPPFEPINLHTRYDIEYPIFYRPINLNSCYFYLYQTANRKLYFKTLTNYINTNTIINEQLLQQIKEDVVELKIKNINQKAILELRRIFKQKPNVEINVFDLFNMFLLFIQQIAIEQHPFPKTFDEFGLTIYTQKKLNIYISKDYKKKELQFAYEIQQSQIVDFQVFTDLFIFILQINDVICFQCGENAYYYDENNTLQIINITRSVQQLLMRKHPTYFYFNYIDLADYSNKQQDREQMLDYVANHCGNTIRWLSNYSYYSQHGQVIHNDQFTARLYDAIIRNVQYDFVHGNYLHRHYIEYIISKEDGEYNLQSLFNMTQNEGITLKILENTNFNYAQSAYGSQQYSAMDETFVLVPDELNIQLNTIDESQVLEIEVTTLPRSKVHLINQAFSSIYYLDQYIKRQVNIHCPVTILKIKSQESNTLIQLSDKQIQKIKEILVEKNDQNDIFVIHCPGYLVLRNDYVKQFHK